MKLISCHVENFGKLTDFSYIFEEDLNVLLAGNGWGKSTLAAFLKVMFYGFEGENRRSEEENERLRYRPWGGGAYGGTVTFSRGDRVYRMHRSFGMRKKEDTFLLFDDTTGLSSPDFTENIGGELFGIDRASFTRTVFWSQQDHATEATTMIQAKIGDLSAEESDLPDYDRAIRQVQREIDRLSPDRASGQIRKKEARAAVLAAEAARLPQLKRQLAESSADCQNLTAQLDKIRKERQEWMSAERNSLRIATAGSSAEDARSDAPAGNNAGTVHESAPAVDSERRILTAKLSASRKRLESLQSIRRSTAAEGHRERKEYLRIQRVRSREEHSASLALSRRTRTLRVISAAALLAAVLFLVFVGAGLLPPALIAAGIILLGGGFFAAFHSKRAGSEDSSGSSYLEDLREEELALRASLEHLSTRMKRAQAQILEEEQSLRALKTQLARLPVSSSRPETHNTEAGRPIQDGPNTHNTEAGRPIRNGPDAIAPSTSGPDTAGIYSAELSAFDRREEDCREQLARAGRQTEDLRRQIRECLDAAEQLKGLQEELTTLRRRYDICVKTVSFLEEARASFNSRYMNPFLRSFRRYYGMLTGESAQDLQTDADFSITVLREGLPRDPSLMSEGTRDLISLCRRMAMIDAMYPGEKPFLVLDDPFSNLDDERVKGGMRFLRDASLEYQILYLTCHESRV